MAEKPVCKPITVILQYGLNCRLPLCYNFQHKQPSWVYEHLTEKSLQRSVSRKGIKFKEDSLVPQLFKTTNADYKNSGFDRGHLCPAGDMKDNLESLTETFFLSNISPQKPAFNRGLVETRKTR